MHERQFILLHVLQLDAITEHGVQVPNPLLLPV